MAAPACRILTLPILSGSCPIEDCFDTTPYPTCRFRLGYPDRLQRSNDQGRVDLLNGKRSKDRSNICVDRCTPLIDVLHIAPSGSVGINVRLGTRAKGDCLGRIEARGCFYTATMFERVQAVLKKLPASQSRLARLGQRDCRERAQPHISGTAVSRVAEDPRFRARATDL